MVKPYVDKGMSQADTFKAVVAAEIAGGNNPADYSTLPGAKILDETIDVEYSGRAWTYQVCAEFGWF